MSRPATVIDEGRDGDRRYVLVGQREERVLRTGRQLIAAGDLQISFEVWKSNLDLMLQDVREWCEKRAGRVALCYADLRTDKVVVFFVPSSERFDFDLADEMTDLERELIGAGVGWVETLQIPAAEVERFVDPRIAFAVYPRADVESPSTAEVS